LIGERNVTGFTAFGTVVQAVDSQANIALPFADGAIFFAVAVFFAFVALSTNNLLTIGCHSASAQDFT
jgi:hypothetical protein